MDAHVGPQSDPVGGPPQLVDPATAARIATAVSYVEDSSRGGRPRQRRARGPWEVAGVYGFLASGATISAASGATLGSGTVTLCSRSGASLTADGESVTAYNAGGSVTAGAGGAYVALGWVDGDWSVVVVKC